MAERSGELGKETEIDTDVNNDLAVRTPVSDQIDSTDRSGEDSLNDIEDVSDDASSDTEQIRENIEETRAEMSETINAIQEKLSFSNISEQVKAEVSDYVSETIQTAKNTVFDTVIDKGGIFMNYVNKGIKEVSETKAGKTVSQNPLAFGLIGLGAAILYLGYKKDRSYRYKYKNDYARDNQNYERDFSSENEQSSIKTMQNKISDAAGKVGSTVSEAAGAVSDTVGNVAGKAYQQAENLGSKAGDLTGTVQHQYEYYMEENPLAVGAVALALGAAVGMAIPSTRMENRYMGEARNNLLQKAEETARDTIEKVQQVAGQVTETVKEEAKNQGLT